MGPESDDKKASDQEQCLDGTNVVAGDASEDADAENDGKLRCLSEAIAFEECSACLLYTSDAADD